MSKVFLIIGKSFSGKDTLLNELLNDNVFCENNNLCQLVRYTTRRQRPGEIDHKDYHFIDNRYYLDNFKNNPKVVKTAYKSEFGELYYITDLSNLEPDKNYIMTGDVESIKPFKNILGDDLCVIWLCPPDWVLFERFVKRNDSEEYSDKKFKEIQRRYVDDLIKFSRANEFLVNTTVMINLSQRVFKTHIKLWMQKFIEGNSTCAIFTDHGTSKFINNNDVAIMIETYSELSNSLNNGIINICNGRVILDTKNEKVEIDEEIKIF